MIVSDQAADRATTSSHAPPTIGVGGVAGKSELNVWPALLNLEEQLQDPVLK